MAMNNSSMDSSNDSCNYNNPISFFENDIIDNSTSKLDYPSSYSSFNYFPNSPHSLYESEYLCELYHHLLSDNQHNPTNMETPLQENASKAISPVGTEKPAPIPSCRSSKKDRHSKINTARGPRDRRMRLSLDVARKFFDLQDMLGYDKASRTIDWLIKNSSLAIRDLERRLSYNMGANYYTTLSSTTSECDQEVERGKKVKKKGRHKVVARATVERESREKARERARARTSQKIQYVSDPSERQKPGAGEGDNDGIRFSVNDGISL